MSKSNRVIRVLISDSLTKHPQIEELMDKGNDVEVVEPSLEYDLILHPLAFRVVPGMEDFSIKEAVKQARKQKYGKKEE